MKLAVGSGEIENEVAGDVGERRRNHHGAVLEPALGLSGAGRAGRQDTHDHGDKASGETHRPHDSQGEAARR